MGRGYTSALTQQLLSPFSCSSALILKEQQSEVIGYLLAWMADPCGLFELVNENFSIILYVIFLNCFASISDSEIWSWAAYKFNT